MKQLRFKIPEYIFIIILFINVACIVLNISKPISSMVFIHIILFFLSAFLFLPFLKHLEKEHFRVPVIRIISFFRVLFGIIFYLALYRIYFSRDYTLSISYWLVFLSFFTMLLLHGMDLLVSAAWNHKHKKKKYVLYILLNLLLLPFLFVLPGNAAYNELSVPAKQIELKDLKIPVSITIFKHNMDDSNESSQKLPSVTITNPVDIKMVMDNFDRERIKNYNPTEKFNYERMKQNNRLYYKLKFSYDTKGLGLLEGCIQSMELTPNRFAVIEDSGSLPDLLKGTYNYNDYYPLTLTSDTYNLLFDYIGLIHN